MRPGQITRRDQAVSVTAEARAVVGGERLEPVVGVLTGGKKGRRAEELGSVGHDRVTVQVHPEKDVAGRPSDRLGDSITVDVELRSVLRVADADSVAVDVEDQRARTRMVGPRRGRPEEHEDGRGILAGMVVGAVVRILVGYVPFEVHSRTIPGLNSGSARRVAHDPAATTTLGAAAGDLTAVVCSLVEIDRHAEVATRGAEVGDAGTSVPHTDRTVRRSTVGCPVRGRSGRSGSGSCRSHLTP